MYFRVILKTRLNQDLNFLLYFFKSKKIKSFLFDNTQFEPLCEITETRGKINSSDISLNWNKIIYGCTNGYLKIYGENAEFNELNLNDRIIRCCLSPCEK